VVVRQILFRLGEVLDWMPDRVTKPKRYNNTMLFRMQSEVPPIKPIRLKVEINCMEHFNVLGLQQMPFSVDNSWFSGNCNLTTYSLDELVGTKLRALYQRKKGRDLFDMQLALMSGKLDVERVMDCYQRYMEFVVDQVPTYKQYVQNMTLKLQDPEFIGDTDLLFRVGTQQFDPVTAYNMLKESFIDRMSGRRD